MTGAKVRPALVLTPDHLLPCLEDVLCLFISSAMPDDLLSEETAQRDRRDRPPETLLTGIIG